MEAKARKHVAGRLDHLSQGLRDLAGYCEGEPLDDADWNLIQLLLRTAHLMRAHMIRLDHPPGKKGADGQTEIPF